MFINFMTMSRLKNSDIPITQDTTDVQALEKKRINYVSSHTDYIMENTTDNNRSV